MFIGLSRTSASLLTLTCAGHLAAQTSIPGPVVETAAGDQSGITDIVVTAQRRTESLQRTALTVEVLNPNALAVAGVTAPGQLTSVLPTVQISAAGASTGVYIRGVGGFPAGALTSPAVPYYTDGIYVARTQSVISEFYDVERVELLKGPQGTLYGRNASGGAVNILTVRPRLGEFSLRGSVELGDYGNQNGEVAINVPMGDTVALRASGTIVDKNGFTSVGLGDDIHQAGRVKLLWEPSGSLSLLLNASYGHIGGRAGAFVALNREIPGWYPWLDASDPRSQAFSASTAVVPVPGFVRESLPSDARQDLNFYNVSGQLDWKLGETTLTVIPAYRESRMRFSEPIGFLFQTGYSFAGLTAHPETSKATSVETRLSGDSNTLKWVAGVYFYDERQAYQSEINMGLLAHTGFTNTPGTRSYAAFGQATFSLNDQVRLIGGLRYTSDHRDITGQTYLFSPNLFLGPPLPSAAPCAFPFPTQSQCLVDSYAGSKTFTNLSWKGGVEADVLGDSLFYATASRGFKAGGFNQQSTPGQPGSAQPFQPEILTSYETGLKSRFLRNRLQLNVSGFYWDYKDHQEPFIIPSNGISGQVYLNAGKIEIYGGTVDLVARPWSGATISGAVEYAHSRYKNFLYTVPTSNYSPTAYGCPATSAAGTTTLDCSGYEVARTPEWAGRVGAEQEFMLGTGRLVAEGSVTFASARWLGTDFIPAERVKGYGKVDASLTYRTASNWSLTGFVRNITNASVYTDGGKIPLSSLIYANIQPPCTYGGRLDFNF